MPENDRKPSLRFKGFNDAWEQREFGYFFSERNERTGEGEMISVTMNSGIKKFKDLERFDTKPEDLSKYKKVVVGDIAFNSMRMWQGASGYSPYTGILSPAYTVITPKNGNSSLFFSYVLKKPEMIQLFQASSQGLTKDTWNLKFPAFSKLLTFAPNNYDEQCNIANILTKVDSLITLHQRKYDKLVNVKKALLDKMFPENGNDVPKVRFKGFTDAWEQRKLGQFGFYISDGNYGELYPKADQLIYQGIPFIRVNNIKNGYLTNKDLIFIPEKLHETLLSGHLETDDILITNRGQIGLVAYVDKSFNNANINAQICLIRTRKEMYSKYLHQYLQTASSQSEILAFQTGSALKQLPRARLNDLTVKFPVNKTEQKFIGDLFFSIDNLITLHQRKHEKLQNIKKALLSKMFA